MNVRDLIAELEDCDPDAKVIASVRDGEEVREAEQLGEDSHLNLDNGPTVMLS